LQGSEGRNAGAFGDLDGLIRGYIQEYLPESGRPADYQGIYARRRAQAEVLMEAVHDAVAFAAADLADLNAPGAVRFDAGTNGIAVGAGAGKAYGQEVVILLGIIEPDDIRNIAGGSVDLGIAAIDIEFAIVVEVAYGVGFHLLGAEGLQAIIGEGAVTVVAIKMVPGAGHDDIEPAVVVEIAEDALNGEALNGDTTAGGNIGENTGAIIE